MKSLVLGVVLAVFVALAASSPRGRSDNQGEYCTEYDMKCTFPPVTHEGEAIHNRGAILEDCGCNRSSAQLRCTNELLVHEVKYCRCACKSR